MIRSKLGLKALVLSGLVLGLMAFATSAAQAETGAKWNVVNSEGKLVEVTTAGLSPQLEIKEIENKTATLAFTTKGGTKVGILCTTAAFDEGGKLISAGGVSLGRILFSKCAVSLNGVLSPACKAHTLGKATGEILTLKAEGLLMLDKESETVTSKLVLLKPDTGTTFAEIEMGEECAIGELVKVEGELFLKDVTGVSNELVEHLISEGLKKLVALGVPAVIEGTALVRLSGAHLGLKFSGTV